MLKLILLSFLILPAYATDVNELTGTFSSESTESYVKNDHFAGVDAYSINSFSAGNVGQRLPASFKRHSVEQPVTEITGTFQ